MMRKDFDNEEYLLFEMLSLVFSEAFGSEFEHKAEMIIIKRNKNSDTNWQKFIDIADKHGVLSLLYDVLSGGEVLPASLRQRLKVISNSIILQNYHLLFLSRTVIELLEKADIPAVILKGCTTSEFYPVPELRKSGDVDVLLLNKDDIKKTEEVLTKAGFKKNEEQMVHHHIAFVTKEGIEIEMHVMFAEPFDNNKTNRCLEKIYNDCKEQVNKKDVMGVMLPVLDDGYHAFYLLLHMLQHFLRSGFGLKLFCDWVAYFRHDIDEKQCKIFMQLVNECGLLMFAQTVTAACVGYLGLSASKVSFIFEEEITIEKAKQLSKNMMFEVVEAEEFGHSSIDRMVIVRGSGINGYIREFHHQMHLNYPKCGKIFLFWPVLWIATLIRFIYNNRKIRKTTSVDILKKAKKRSRLLKEIELFK